MPKILVQKTVTVTLELSEKEAAGLSSLLQKGVTGNTLDYLNLIDLAKTLSDSFPPAPISFKEQAKY